MSGINKIDDFLKSSKEYYYSIKEELEQKFTGKYVAVSYDIKKYWVGVSMTEALKLAKNEFPDKLFYVIQIGSDSIFTIQSIGRKVINF